MEQVDYKEKYEDLIKRITKMANCQPTITKLAIESLFPELAESENERIMKAIKSVVSYNVGNNKIYGVSKEDMIAWLEKQSKDSPILSNFSNIRESSWSEEDEEYCQCLIKDIENSDPLPTSIYSDCKKWLKSLKDRVQPKQDSNDRFFEGFKKGEQSVIENYGKYGLCKPTEWSEEDEMHIRELESLVKQVWAIAERENDRDKIHKMSDLSFFLKTLKPQPKQEWSEEDEGFLCKCLGALGNPNYCYEDGELECMRNWLKSIRPKSQWKPSDEQMDALKSSTYCQNEQMSKVLFELYQDLKKLREE